MFYCNKCAEEFNYPISLAKSKGPCEICGEVAICNDVSTKDLGQTKFGVYGGIGLAPQKHKQIHQEGLLKTKELIKGIRIKRRGEIWQ